MRNKTKKERKSTLMKTTLKSIIALIVCIATVITSISAGTGTAYAAGKKLPLKVGFNGTVVTLINDLNTSNRLTSETPKLKKLKEKWGKPDQTKHDSRLTSIWKKGETSIQITNSSVKDDEIGGITIDIKDKNGSLFGVKVGMKTATALKKLKKVAGNKNVTLNKDGDDLYIVVVNNTYMPSSFTLTNGKVSSIYWYRS